MQLVIGSPAAGGRGAANLDRSGTSTANPDGGCGAVPIMERHAMQKHIGKEKSSAARSRVPRAKARAAAPDRRPPHHGFDLRTALEWLRTQGDLIETDKEVDPDL